MGRFEGEVIDGPKHYFSEPFATQIKRAMIAADETRKARAAGKPAPVQEYLPNKPMSLGQRKFLVDLGYTGPTGLTMSEASALINDLKRRR